MNDTTIIANRSTDAKAAVLDEGAKPTSTAAPTPEISRPGRLPLWLARPLGSLALRACPIARDSEICKGCHLRALCKCAQEDFLARSTSERWIWLVLTLCGGVSVLYAAWCFLFR